MVVDGRFCDGLKPGKLLEITVNGTQFVPSDEGTTKKLVKMNYNT